jgi:DNA-binding LacI/PurR family transcriptional regulator
MAYGAMQSMRKHGLKCPEDISLIGFDGHEMADFANLTTIAQPVQTMGELAAWAVMEKLNKPDTPAKHINLPTTLIVRGSTRAL